MKRIICIALCFIALVSFAVKGHGLSDESQMFYTVEMRNDTGTVKKSLIPTTTIRPNVDKIIGYTVQKRMNTTLNSENWVIVYDSGDAVSTGSLFTDKEMLGESECFDDNVGGRFFPRARPVTEGISVVQGAQTDVVIYFIRE